MNAFNEKLALALLKHLNAILEEKMEYAKRHKDERSVNIAGFCAELKRELSRYKAEIIGKL